MGNPPRDFAFDNTPHALKSPGIIISKKRLSKVPIVIDSLENPLMMEWESITHNQHLPDIEKFANSIKKLGKKYQIKTIIEYGEKLLLHVNNFDIENIQAILKNYHGLIKQIKELSIGEDA